MRQEKSKEIQELMDFLDNSLTCYHAIAETAKKLETAGYQRLSEKEIWSLEAGKSYYVVRNDSSLMAFQIPKKEIKGFHIFAAHSDSPSFKVKENPEMEKEGNYVCVNTEKYGGMIMSTWMDRPLTIAGRVCMIENGEIVSYPVKLQDNLCMIPNLAIHMNRDVNKGVELNPQIDMLPLICMKEDKVSLKSLLKNALKDSCQKDVAEDEILAGDLFVVNSEKAVLAGIYQEFIMTGRYDDLGCVYGGLRALLDSEANEYINVLAVFDNEEVGSLTRQGADSTFLRDTLDNIADGLGKNGQTLRTWIADSFLLSADNAHACHPNQGGKADPTNRPMLNKGVVLKFHGSQKYATDGFSAAYVKKLAKKADVQIQTFANRSDLVGGSTLGNLAMAQVSMAAADIGLPQLAMHSAYETAGSKDIIDLIELTREFFK